MAAKKLCLIQFEDAWQQRINVYSLIVWTEKEWNKYTQRVWQMEFPLAWRLGGHNGREHIVYDSAANYLQHFTMRYITGIEAAVLSKHFNSCLGSNGFPWLYYDKNGVDLNMVDQPRHVDGNEIPLGECQ